MGQRRQKVVKQQKKEDQLIELPDGILSTIISFMTLKEALRTSILSKRWRFIWTYHSDLWFDSDNILGCKISSNKKNTNQLDSDRQLQRSMFVERVNQLMHQRYEGQKIDSLAVHFHLGRESAPHIDQWIRCAATKGVEKLDLDLSECCFLRANQNSSTASEYYEFPCWFLAGQGRKRTVKHLRLASCSVSGHPSLNSLTSLITIELREVNISDQQLKNLLSNCLLLERLCLNLCNDLADFKFSAPSLQLKFLKIENCFGLRKIELHAENLATFEYTGHFIVFSFKNVPKLAEAFLNFTGDGRLDGVTYALTRFVNDLPQLETLNVLSIFAMKTIKLPERGYTFSNIKKLVLTIFPFDDEDTLCWITCVLKAFPYLQKLQLNLFSPSYIKQPKEIERLLPECHHNHVTEVEINGFHGNKHEVDLLKYLVNNLDALEVLAVSPRQRVCKGHKYFIYEETSSWLGSIREGLHALVPPTVHLEIG